MGLLYLIHSKCIFKDLDTLDFEELEKKYFPDPSFMIKLVRKIKIESFKAKNKILNLMRRKEV